MKEIPLTQGKVALVDDEDFAWLSQWKWQFSAGYAIHSTQYKSWHMHRMIANTPDGMFTDHINGNPLDNRRCNLRICSQRQNLKNRKRNPNGSSQYKGVGWNADRGLWESEITNDRKRWKLGTYRDEYAAALVYDAAARILHGEYAALNFPNEEHDLLTIATQSNPNLRKGTLQRLRDISAVAELLQPKAA